MDKLSKYCYECGKEKLYKDTRYYWSFVHNNNILCTSCVSKKCMSKPVVRLKLSVSVSAAFKKPEINKKYSLAQKNRFRYNSVWNKGIPMSDDAKLKLSFSRRGKCMGDENPSKRPDVRKKIRLGVIRYIESCKGKCVPRYNPFACQRIDEYGKQNGLKFQHAENGGEFHIKELGYFVDGYDKEKNVVIEYYEKHHNRPENVKRDATRKQEIVNTLGCQFVELRRV